MDLLGDMTLFVAVGRTKSFSAAAKATRVPLSSLSRRLAALEETLGVSLLHRTSRSVELTEPGRMYFERARVIVEAAAAAEDELRGLVGHPRGRVRVSMPADFGELFLTPLFAEYANRYPEVSFEFDLSPRFVDLVAEGFDIAIRFGPQPDSGLATRKIASIRMGAYASVEYLKQYGEPKVPAELGAHSCLRLLRGGGAVERWDLHASGKKASVDVNGRAAANHPGMLQRLAKLGLGIALLDEILVVDDLESGALCRVLRDWSPPPIPVCAVTPSKRLPAKTRLLLDCLSEHIQRVQTRVERANGGK